MSDSILESTKKVIGLEPENEDFDVDVTMHINSIFSVLGQLGVGPADGFMILDASATWSDFLDDVKLLNMVKTYMYLRVRLLFDPPSTSFTIEAQERQFREFEWRINLQRESALNLVEVIL